MFFFVVFLNLISLRAVKRNESRVMNHDFILHDFRIIHTGIIFRIESTNIN